MKYVSTGRISRLGIQLTWIETNKSARLAFAKATRRSSDMVASTSRVRSTSKAAFARSWRSRSAMSSVISFSATPDSDTAPLCAPP